MEPTDPMFATELKGKGYTASFHGAGLTEDEVQQLAYVLARAEAERRVRDVFADHTRKPVNRTLSRIGSIMSAAFGGRRRVR